MSWDEDNPVRFAMEQYLIKRFYPDARLQLENGIIRILKRVRGERGVYDFDLRYSSDHPWSPIEPYLLSPKVTGIPHQFNNGKLCFYQHGEVGPSTTGKVFCDWAVQWVRFYEKWRRTGRWD